MKKKYQRWNPCYQASTFRTLITNLKSMLGVKRFLAFFLRAAEFLLARFGDGANIVWSVLFPVLVQIAFGRKLLSTFLAFQYIAPTVTDHVLFQIWFIVGLVAHGAFCLLFWGPVLSLNMTILCSKILKLDITLRAPEGIKFYRTSATTTNMYCQTLQYAIILGKSKKLVWEKPLQRALQRQSPK